MNKRGGGVKCLFYPLFGQKMAEFVLFLKNIMYSQLNFELGGGTNGLMGGIKDFPRGGGGQASMGGTRV